MTRWNRRAAKRAKSAYMADHPRAKALRIALDAARRRLAAHPTRDLLIDPPKVIYVGDNRYEVRYKTHDYDGILCAVVKGADGKRLMGDFLIADYAWPGPAGRAAC